MNGKTSATIRIGGRSENQSAGGVSFGITSAKLSKLQNIGGDAKAKLWVDLRRSLESLLWVCSHVHDLVIEGKKDEARDWCRFVSNSCLIDVLASPLIRELSRVSESDLAALKAAFVGAQGSCHPENVTSVSTDIAAVRNQLAQIVSDVSEIKTILSASVHNPAATGADRLAGGLMASTARQSTFEFTDN